MIIVFPYTFMSLSISLNEMSIVLFSTLYSQDADLFIDPAAASSDIFFSFLIFLSIIFPLSTNILAFCLL